MVLYILKVKNRLHINCPFENKKGIMHFIFIFIVELLFYFYNFVKTNNYRKMALNVHNSLTTKILK